MSSLLSKQDMVLIDTESKYTIFGFVRESQRLLSTQIIPQLVAYIILSYYYTTDEFDPNLCGPNIIISDNNSTIKDKGLTKWSTVYGKTIIESATNGIYIWQFKNIGTSIHSLNIGIDNANASYINRGFHGIKSPACYAYHPQTGHVWRWYERRQPNRNKIIMKSDEQFKTNSIITMKLVFNDNGGILSFKINDEPELIAAYDVKRDKELKYRLAISCYVKGTSLQII